MEVELHEDKVPELEEAVAVTAGRTVGAAAAVLGSAAGIATASPVAAAAPPDFHKFRVQCEAGDGFFVRADQPYAYTAGPDGIEILEFRGATGFDMKIFDQTIERWKPIMGAAAANHDRWVATRPD